MTVVVVVVVQEEFFTDISGLLAFAYSVPGLVVETSDRIVWHFATKGEKFYRINCLVLSCQEEIWPSCSWMALKTQLAGSSRSWSLWSLFSHAASFETCS
jgi:hypothetical protein